MGSISGHAIAEAAGLSVGYSANHRRIWREGAGRRLFLGRRPRMAAHSSPIDQQRDQFVSQWLQRACWPADQRLINGSNFRWQRHAMIRKAAQLQVIDGSYATGLTMCRR